MNVVYRISVKLASTGSNTVSITSIQASNTRILSSVILSGPPGPAGPQGPIGPSASTLTSSSTRTSSFTASPNTYYPVDATSGNITVTLPTSVSGQELAIKKIDSSVNLVTISGTINGAVGTLPLRLQNQGKVLIPDMAGGWNVYAGDINLAALDLRYNPLIAAGTTSQYFRGDKTFQTLDKTSVGLTNVDNSSDANKPISTATQTALNAKQGTLSLTTTGSSGAATLVANTLNIPQYSGGTGNMNTSTYDPAGINQQVVGTTAVQTVSNKDLTSGTNTFPTFNQSTTGSAASLTTARTIGTLTGDVVTGGSTFNGTANNSNATTLATVNSNVGSFGTASSVPTQTVNAKGLTTAISNAPIQITESQVTSLTTDLAAKLSNITGLVTAGTNVTITGSGTSAAPYVVNSSGSGGGTTVNYYQSVVAQEFTYSASNTFTLSQTPNTILEVSINGQRITTAEYSVVGTNLTVTPSPHTFVSGDSVAVLFLASTAYSSTGGFSANSVTKTAAYTITTSDYTVLCNTTTAGFTVTLPTAISNTQIYHIKKISTDANTLTIATTSSQTIDGATTVTTAATSRPAYEVQSDGANWWII